MAVDLTEELPKRKPTHLKHLAIHELTICEMPANQHSFASIYKSADEIAAMASNPETVRPARTIEHQKKERTMSATDELENAVIKRLEKRGLVDDRHGTNRSLITEEVLQSRPELYDALEVERIAEVASGDFLKSVEADKEEASHSRVEKMALARADKHDESFEVAIVKVMQTEAGMAAYEADELDKMVN